MAISCSLSDVSERTSEIAAFLIHQNKDGLRLLLLFRCKTGPRLLEDVSCLLRWDSTTKLGRVSAVAAYNNERTSANARDWSSAQ